MRIASALAFLCLLPVSAPPLFGQAPLIWESATDFSGRSDLLRSVSAVGNSAITAGNASVTGGLDLAVLKYNADGSVPWTDQKPLSSGINTNVFTATLGNKAYAAGYSTLIPNDSDIFVRAYNAVTGRVLWDDVFSKGRDDLPQGLAAGSSAVVVVGYGGNRSVPTVTALNALIRAYDPATGQVLWEDEVDKGDSIDDIAWTVSIDGDRVFVAGTTNALGASRNMIIRAYQAQTGALLWEIQRAAVSPVAITATSGRLFVAGSSNASNTFLAAFNEANGRLIWEDLPMPGIFVDVKVQYPRVVGVGSSLRGSLVRVYRAPDGKVLWQDVTAPAPGFRESLAAVVVTDEAVYATGTSGQDLTYTEFLVRAYDLFGGGVLFEDRSHRSGELGGSQGFDIAAGTTHVYAVGAAADGASQDFLIRAYDRTAVEPGLRLLVWLLRRLALPGILNAEAFLAN